MTPFRSRPATVALAAVGLSAALAIAGCSAGQIAQTANQQPAVNGTLAWVGEPTTGIALRNLHLRVDQTSDYVEPGSVVELLFVAVNESANESDRLVSITSDVGTVVLSGDVRVPAAGTLVVGTPDGQPSPLDATERAESAQAAVALTQPLSNGLTYPFTFTFQRSGQRQIQVPISAGESPRREAEAAGSIETGAESGAGGH